MIIKHSNSEIVKFAKDFAMIAHEGQTRKFSGEPYFNHVERVALNVYMMQDNIDLVCAAYLHDLHEDTNILISSSLNFVQYQFSPVIHTLVKELTNVYTKEYYPKLNRQERKKLETIRLSNVGHSAKIIKLADRLDNIRDFSKNDPTFGPEHYYVAETRKLIWLLNTDDMISNVNSIGILQSLTEQIQELIDFERNPGIGLQVTVFS